MALSVVEGGGKQGLFVMKNTVTILEEIMMLKIAIIIGSTRPGRRGESGARWIYEIARKPSDAEYELVDIADFNLPLLDEPNPPVLEQYTKPHTWAWSKAINAFDGYVFVTPEYNHATSGALTYFVPIYSCCRSEKHQLQSGTNSTKMIENTTA